MTGGRCHRRRKMMGRGADGGCGTEEKPCPTSRFPTKIPAKQASILEKHTRVDIDFYTQARKALCERSPFDTEDAVSTIATLPSGLANFLSKHLDSRKRHKKSHSGVEAKSSRAGGAKSRGSNFWAETEEYFRELTMDDIKKLYEVSSFGFSASGKCFSIPFLGNAFGDSAGNGYVANGANDANANGANGANVNGAYDVNVNGVGSNCKVVEEEVKKFMEVDSVGINGLPQEEKGCSSLLQSVASSSGLDWLLGSRNKIYLTSDRPSKKRKLLGGDAGLEKLLTACPVEVSVSLCHYCSLGDTGDQLNRLIVCSSCNVAVHQRCYGVQDDVADSWLCSWCKQRKEVQNTDRPCLLCPRQGGALKPVRKIGVGSENGRYGEFAHLFCCQWMPEVYIEDRRTMEPIMKVEGIKETWRKLVCYLCKVKCGACVRCSNGTCRTSFHPICAREARHRMEIWGKFGCDDVELRAFCSKHSEVQNSNITQQLGDLPVAVGSSSCITEHQSLTSTLTKPPKLKFGRKNGDKITVHIETIDTNNNKLGDSVLHEEGLSDSRSNSRLQSECGVAQQPVNMEPIERKNSEDFKSSDSVNFKLILKKLIDRGKVNVKDVASEIGVSPDSLPSMLSDDCLVPDLRWKIVKWLRNHAYISTSQKNLKAKIKSAIASKDEMGGNDDSEVITVSELDIRDVVPVKSVPPRRRTKSNIRIMKDNKVICPSKEMINNDGIVLDEVRSDQLVSEDPDYSSKEPVPDATEKILIEPVGVQDTLASNSPKPEGDSAKPLNCSLSEGGQRDEAVISEQKATVNSDLGNPICSVIINHIADLIKAEVSSSYIHPLIKKKLMQMQNGLLSDNTTYEFDGSRDQEVSPLGASPSSSICCNHQNQHSQHSTSSDMVYKFDGVNLEQLVKARNIGVLELSPKDEVEGELIFYQHKLLCNAVATKRFSDDLICKVVKSLPEEIDAVGKQKWDAVLVNQYLCEVREAIKQGRKERRHKEAQAVLAAATAAAAASSRISLLRKDTLEESGHLESTLKVNTSSGRAGLCSQQNPRAKETLSRLAVARVSSEKNSDFVQSTSDCKDHPRTCDICRQSETILNPILVCSSCKVAVHLDCYRSVKDSTGPWYCELCEDLLSSRFSGAPAVNSWEKPYFVAECSLCGGTTGAFRKSTDGQWIHAFCAEWVLESTFRRGQVNPVEGMESISKGGDVCHMCRRRQGVCIKCNYGHCQSTFHPSCARSASYYMNVKTHGGKLQHKAYCEKHSLEQRLKAETQKHGIGELKSLKKVRVELERLRLLCERIIKREKLKRELILCSHDMCASNRDSVALSALIRSPFFPPDSSESATTSLKGQTDDYRSGSEAIQRSDDITVDSAVSGKYRIKFPMSMDNDQKTDDSSTSQHLFMQKPMERASFSGKQIPHRPSSVASRNLPDDGEKRSKSGKHTETFGKELVMTSDQASMKNQRLPKGFVYVPIQCLSKEEENIQDACSREPLERDG